MRSVLKSGRVVVFAIVTAAGMPAAMGQAPASAGGSQSVQASGIAESVPAFAGSKAGAFVLSFVGSPEAATASRAALRDVARLYAGVAVGVVSGTTADAPAEGGVVTVSDGDGGLAKRFGAAPGVIVVVNAGGKEIGRFDAPADAAKIGDSIERSRRAPTAEYNLPKNTALALDGYDATSYFDAASNKGPVKGVAAITSRYRGVVYRFATESNRDRFNADPEKFVPTYGGWCATAMARGEKVEIDPTNYKVTNGRLFLFYKGFLGNAKKDWDKDESGLEKSADREWAKAEKK
jgi:YHS domain-containing protein